MNFRIVHRTTYDYSEPVTVSHHAACVKPRALAHQQRLEFSLRIVPDPPVRKERTDYFGNRVCFFSIQELHQRLEIIAESVVNVTETTPPVASSGSKKRRRRRRPRRPPGTATDAARRRPSRRSRRR